jgi:hypothetical protein
VDWLKNNIFSFCASSLAVPIDMAAAPPPQASRMILHQALVHRLRQNTSKVFIRTDFPFCCDQMRALCAPGTLRPSPDNYPSCLFYGGPHALGGQCIMNTPIKTAPDPRNRMKFETHNFVRFESTAHFFESLLPIRDDLLLLPENTQGQRFAELRHSIYTAIALDALKVRGTVCRANSLTRGLIVMLISGCSLCSGARPPLRKIECRCPSVRRWQSLSCFKAH